ncbi:MAG: glycosyltransferase family 4 protein [Limisphaerales bacterium]
MLTTDSRECFRDYNRDAPYFGTAPEALLQGLVEMADIEVHVVSCLQQKVVSPEKIGRNIWYHGLYVPKFGWLKTGYQGCIRAVKSCLREIKPDIVHGQGTERDCALTAVLSGYPNVLTLHGNMRRIAQLSKPLPFSYLWLTAILEKIAVRRTGGVICLSNHAARNVAGIARRTWILPNAVDERFFSTNRGSLARPVILCVAGILRLKNQIRLIEALDPLAATKSFHLRFFGAANPKDAYTHKFLQLVKQRAWCEFCGFASRDQLRQQLAEASLLVLPSLEENCPMAVLEAMAANVPVIASNVGGIPDLVENNVSGLLIDPSDLNSIRTSVATALEKPEYMQQIARTAKQRAWLRFHPKAVADYHLQIYREVLSRRS